MIAFKSSKIIVVMILEPSTGTPGGGDSRHLDLEGMYFCGVACRMADCRMPPGRGAAEGVTLRWRTRRQAIWD